MADLKNPIEMMIVWLNKVKDNPFAGNIGFLVLTWCPEYETSKLRLKKGVDYTQILINYLSSITDPMKVIGMSLFIERAISFVVRDYDNSDKMLDSMLDASTLADSSEDPEDKVAFEAMREREPITFEQKKALKESWDAFKGTFLNFEVISFYQSSIFLKKFGGL